MTSRVKIKAGWTVREALRKGIERLAEAGVPSHALAAELLLMHAVACDRAWLYAYPEAPLDEDAARVFLEMVSQRAKGVPTQYLTSKQEFWGLEFEVTPAVLIPRPETEHIIEVALARVGENRRCEKLRVADIGTGSGCIAIALTKELSNAEILATDISADALAIAERNARRHGVSERVRFAQCDLLPEIVDEKDSSEPRFDLIVSNPPYVALAEENTLPREVHEHEPHAALFGGPAGTEIYPRLIVQAAKVLRAGGLFVVEIGYGAAEQVRAAFDKNIWRDIRITNDLADIARVVSAERTHSPQ